MGRPGDLPQGFGALAGQPSVANSDEGAEWAGAALLVHGWQQESELLDEHPTLLVPLGDSSFTEEALFPAGAFTMTLRVVSCW